MGVFLCKYTKVGECVCVCELKQNFKTLTSLLVLSEVFLLPASPLGIAFSDLGEIYLPQGRQLSKEFRKNKEID